MDVALLTFLALILALAALLYYVFLVKRAPDLGARGVGWLITIVCILVPVILFAFWNQSASGDRLKEIGFNVHPALQPSFGIATGIGENPVWVFASDSDTDQIVQFYKSQQNYSGWQLVYEGKNMLVYESETQSLYIYISEDDVIFALNSRQ